MGPEDSLEARQSNELEALQAIYGEELKDLRKKAAWNKWSPLNLSITLTPQRGSSENGETHIKLDLHIVCSEKYPEKVPEILLENVKGISHTILQELKQDLIEKAQQYEGEEVIFQLCQYVEEFLHKHKKPAMKSFYDEMLMNQEEKKRQEELQKQLEEEKQRETLKKEVEKRQELLRTEARLRKERQRSISEIESEEDVASRRTIRQRSSSVAVIEELKCDHKKTILINFNGRNVKRGQCLRHYESYAVLYSGMDLDSGELVQIAEWKIEHRSPESVLKQLSGIEQEFNYLTTLKHKNLNHYLGFKHELIEGIVIVYVLMEFTQVPNYHALLTSQNLKIDLEYLKCVTKDILTALEYLHRNNVVHKSLGDSCIRIDDKGIIKVSDYSIYKRLSDLIRSSHGSYNKKTDIFDFGKYVLKILGQEAPDDDNIEIPTHIQSDFYDFLIKCLNKEEKERYTANQLLNHPFFQKPVNPLSPLHVPNELPPERNSSPEISHSRLSSGNGNTQSRISNEFEILEHLGKGAFGDVLKARNKLDGGCYAIKRIKLNPRNKNLNKKIVREVTLLSRLNHENVVRYYNSWIETTTILKGEQEDESSVNSSVDVSPVHDKPVQTVAKKDVFTLSDDIEKLAPPMKNIEISVTYDSKSHAPYDDESSEDDSSDDDEDDPFTGKFHPESDSDSDLIEFARGSGEGTTTSSSSKSSAPPDEAQGPLEPALPETVLQIDYLYIQMEFCEKSTLRSAIDDDNLYLNEDRVWRLFREIVEGLAHIHLQGMIHRDLKPVNIFLDSFDHVKIGDFGLATTIAIRYRQGEIGASARSQTECLREDLADESKTGQVGTALYVAPEINSASRAVYNEKVDIYSLGIILFEMSYRPLPTAMERIKVLTKLRMKEVLLPDDFCTKKQFLIKWLLNHDIAKRPTSLELLQSEHLPPPILEDRELQELVRHTLSNPQSKGYRFLISSCFKQTITPAQDITYDRDPANPICSKSLNLYNFVREVCVKTFKLHGGQNVVTPLLMPQSKFHEDTESCVRLMTHIGNIVTLSHDLRVPFARYLAWNGITTLKRYSVERACKEKKVFGFVPREFYECAFDIVSPTQGNLMPDAEILCIVYKIINELPGMKHKHFQIRLNHTSLFRAILMHCGLKEEQDLLRLLSDIKESKVPKSQLQDFLIHKELSDSNITLLTNFLNNDFELTKTSNHFHMITRKKSRVAAALIKEAMQELKVIVENARLFGVEFDMVLAPGLTYNIQQFSGMICQVVGELKKKKKHDNKEVVAVGGRYDGMIAHYRRIMEQAEGKGAKEIQQSAVGISISLDKLVQAVQKQDNEPLPKLNALDVIVCSVGCNQFVQEKAKILKDLWAAGVRCALIECSNTVDCQEQLMEVGVSHAIILKDNEQGTVRLKSWEKDSKTSFDRFQEKCYSITEIVQVMQKILKVRNDSLTETAQSATVLSRCDSKTNNSERSENDTPIDVLLVTSKKLSSNTRRRFENQVKSHLDNTFKKFTTVIAVDIEAKEVRTLTSLLDFDSENAFTKSVQLCIGKHQKHREYMHEICEEIWNVKTKKNNPTLFLYSLIDNFYSVIL
ncbi:eIF-2-alpha kinase GCN2 isoform X2 [Anthonomus grandis grandis]|uniref:eIF-2-alpha kinase GCN2 isoform X2 n=1 Tax=Anthonomus grandis grandis TaxID=2921223 RepID=UPI002166377D|nr:eIF-2-alpha kinase GCN2 isoform X2 [Anthonomus grandis grandis]